MGKRELRDERGGYAWMGKEGLRDERAGLAWMGKEGLGSERELGLDGEGRV